ncbi:DUF2637 domain-containing protein [Embleya sp. NPDC020886]|uniref:DUF2637 domain-containing protein n=1 Tax=Embleya sp. NPDC020886 TaxID=3363980 RepID=UPI003791A6E1
MNAAQVRSAEQALSVGTWLIVAGSMLYSVLTVTPLAAAHTPPEWAWTAPILPLVVDAAVVIVVRLDATLARLGEGGGAWPIVLRWMTGTMTLALNVGDSLLRGDLVGAAVHSVAPTLLIVTAETGLAYRRAITAAQVALSERERVERTARERAEVERREAAERIRREEREYEARVAREQREHEAAVERERAKIAERARREERDAERARERAETAERERREHRERQAVERERRERLELLSADPAVGKLPEDRARLIVRAGFEEGHPVRAAAELCGWSVGWVSARYQEFREEPPAGRLSLVEGAR